MRGCGYRRIERDCKRLRWVSALGGLSLALGWTQRAESQPASGDSGATDGAQLQRSEIEPPRLIQFEHAVYPADAERLGIEASVGLVLTIDQEGHVLRVELREPAGHGFDEAAVAAARGFVFAPATRGGQPIAAKILYRYRFKLDPQRADQSSQNAPSREVPQLGELRGKIQAGAPPFPIAGVLVRVHADGKQPHEIVSDAKGEWHLAELEPGNYDVEVFAVGYRAVTQIEHVDANRATAVVYGLESSDESQLEVTVRGAAVHREVAHYELSRDELVRVPGTMGDAIHAVEAMPSVARPPAFSGALIVRGSAPQDTQVFVEGTLVPRVFHYASLSSVVPSEMIERLEFYPSNFSARYGRAMGGVIEVGLRETNPDGKYHGSAQIDFINTRANVEGPIPLTNGWQFMGGFRTTYVDRWLVPVLRSSGSAIEGMPRYYDYQLYVERKLPNNGVYRIGVFGASDRFVPIEKNPSDWRAPSDSFMHVQSQLRLPITAGTHFKASWSIGRSKAASPDDDDRTMTTTYTLGTLRTELNVATGTIGLMRVGTDFLYAPFKVEAFIDPPESQGALNSAATGSPQLTRYDVRSVYFRPAAYAEYELAPNRRVNVTLGTRLDYTKDTSQWDVAPRLSARYVLNESPLRTVFKGGVGLFYQPPDPGQTLDELGTRGLYSSRAVHSMIGVEQALSKRVTLSVEGFEKELRDLVVTRTDAARNDITENSGSGRVWGADLLLRYQSDSRFFGWLSYTLSRSTRRSAPDEPSQLFAYDQPHILNVLGSYRLGRGWEIGGRFRYISGFLYRACFGGLFDSSTGRYRCYGTPAQNRLEAYHQLDLRLEKTWAFENFRIAGYIDVINTYFHNSPDYAVAKYDLSATKPLSLSLPLLPSIGVRGEL